MPKAIPLSEIRRWLREYESGKSEASISKKTGHDVRTIKKGIERARREHDAHAAREGLLKDAIRQHHNALLDLVREVLSVVDAPLSTGLAAPWKHLGETITIKMGTAVAKMSVGKLGIPEPDTMELSFETKPEWGVLREHLSRDSLYKGFNLWKREISHHIVAKIALQRKVAERLANTTGYQLVGKPVSEPFVYANTTIPLIFQNAVGLALGIPEAKNLKARLTNDTATGEVVFEGRDILGRALGAEEKLLTDIIAVVAQLQESQELQKVVATYENVDAAARKVKRAAEDIRMLGIVPGQCRICRRLGI